MQMNSDEDIPGSHARRPLHFDLRLWTTRSVEALAAEVDLDSLDLEELYQGS